MTVGSRSNKGNKKWAIHDTLLVPTNGFHLQENPSHKPPEEPISPVGKKIKVLNVYLWEISKTYEGMTAGAPQGNVITIPFDEVVGNPISDESIEKGTTVVTSQGETLRVLWNAKDGEYNGLIVYNESAEGTSWYEPNWGNIYGVAIEWETEDGSMSGMNYADRIIGWTSRPYETAGLTKTYRQSSQPKDHAPTAVRPGLMLGNPVPNRTMEAMGYGLPIVVYPALGKIGQGLIFGFNRNVTDFIKIKPTLIPYLTPSGFATARADLFTVEWQKDDHATSVAVLMRIISGSFDSVSFQGPDRDGYYTLGTGLTTERGRIGGTINWSPTVAIDGVIEFVLLDLETGALILCVRTICTIPAGQSRGTASNVDCES